MKRPEENFEEKATPKEALQLVKVFEKIRDPQARAKVIEFAERALDQQKL